MKYGKIILAGGSGYLGGVLAAYFRNLADEVIILSRRPHPVDANIRTVVWDGTNMGNWTGELEGAELLINLCGKSVNCRYTEKNKTEIIRSRLIPTALLGKAINTLAIPPKVWINITSATIYRNAEDRPQDEMTGETGSGFSVEVCKQWEDVFYTMLTPHTRKVALRMGIVFGRNDGVFPRLLNLVKTGLGGRQGTGNQYMSWIHEDDVAGCTEWILNHPQLAGAVNCTAPQPAKNKDVMKCIRKVSKMPFGLPMPAWLLKAGAVIIGTETELILKSRWVLPTKLLETGFDFKFGSIERAVTDILHAEVVSEPAKQKL
jgi:uncharacterized protein (TIGR01777 family)